MSELKYKTGQKLFNKSKNRHYKSFGDLLILGDAKLDGDLACYKVHCFGKEKPVDMINEKELDYHFSTSKTKTEKIYAKRDDGFIPNQIGGNHYSDLEIDPYHYSMVNKLNPLQMNAIKYITRYPFKNGIEDIDKAIHTLERLKEYERSTN